jgi:LAO/AO transport system kinase
LTRRGVAGPPTIPVVIDRDLMERARTGDVRSIARVLSAIEDRTPDGRAMFHDLFTGPTRTAWSTGITGAPGSGKSTLVSSMIPEMLPEDGRLAVVAVDPSSPFSGGAILGDRIRMSDHAGDDRVYIRSLANRGALGGISESTPAVLAALAGLGFEELLVETVGVGQSEVEIATSADTTVVVVSPGWGDSIQASKAGFLEVADVFVVNKADRPDAAVAARDLEAMLAIGPARAWTPPVLETVATDGVGVGAVVAAVHAHRRHLVTSGELVVRRRMRAAGELAAAVRQAVVSASAGTADTIELIERVVAHEIDPWSAADSLLDAR